MKKSKLFKNIITGFGGQFIAIILGLIVPRLFKEKLVGPTIKLVKERLFVKV